MNFERIIKNKRVKLFMVSIIIGVCITSLIQSYSQRVMADISSSVVRLHVIANSDTNKDQELKLKVRDEIIDYLEPVLANANNVEDTKSLIKNNLGKIEEEAKKVVKKYGYTYSVTADFGNYSFPTKTYENAQFPKGRYDALKIVIGKGEGKNWWCVLYPQLCFDFSQNGTLSNESATKLKNVLTYDEFEMITSKSDLNFKFKIVEWFSS